jgi:hypothetical protein
MEEMFRVWSQNSSMEMIDDVKKENTCRKYFDAQ